MIDKLTSNNTNNNGCKGLFDVVSAGKKAAMEFYEEWVEEVKRVVPKERLLVFHVKEGWKPLCEFLDVPEPKVQFPRSNDTEVMKKIYKKRVRAAYIYVLGVPILASICAYGGYLAAKQYNLV